MASENLDFALSYNRSVRVKAGAEMDVTSDAGALLMRSVLEKTGVVLSLVAVLWDWRHPKRIVHSLGDLLRQHLLMLAQGWDRLSDARPLRNDPALRVASRKQRGPQVLDLEDPLASQPTMSRLLSMLSTARNLPHLVAAVIRLGMEHILSRTGGERLPELVIDVDAVPLDAHGSQQGSAYHGHYKRNIFLPLVITCGETGDVLGATLRPGDQHEVNDCTDFIVDHAQQLLEQVTDRVIVRLDAGFNSGDLCKRLEEAGIDYVMRLKKNPVLEKIGYACTELEDEHEICYKEASYRARNWDRERRVVVVGKPHRTLFGRFKCHFLITSLSEKDYEGKQLAALYSRRGKAEMHFGEMKAACSMALSSAARPKSHYRNKPPLCAVSEGENEHTKVRPENEARLQFYMLAYQLVHIGRSLMNDPSAPAMEAQDAVLPCPQELLEVQNEGVGAPAMEAQDAVLPCPQELLEVQNEGVGAPAMEAQDAVLPCPPPPVSKPATDLEAPCDEDIAPQNSEARTENLAAHPPLMHVRTFRLKVLKVGAQLSKHARYLTLHVAASALELWKIFWKNIKLLRWHALPIVG